MKPREKLLKYGAMKLTGSELVATILGTGIKGVDVFSLSKTVNNLLEDKKENISVDDLLLIKGVGKTKAISIVAGLELAKRYYIKDNIYINGVGDILNQVGEYRNKKQEYLLSLTLDGANRLINKRIVTIGLLNQSLAHPREVFSDAILDRANSIVLVHNHPSDSCEPSSSDIDITSRLKDVGKLVGIKILDHIIITKKNYYSFKEHREI